MVDENAVASSGLLMLGTDFLKQFLSTNSRRKTRIFVNPGYSFSLILKLFVVLTLFPYFHKELLIFQDSTLIFFVHSR